MFHANNLLESSGWPGYAGEYSLRLRCLHCALLLVTSCHLYGLCKKKFWIPEGSSARCLRINKNHQAAVIEVE